MENKIYQTILCFGELLWDMLPEGKMPGGAPLNVAIHLKKQGIEPILISKIGEDENGTDLIRFIEKSGINPKFIQKDKQLDTSQVLVYIDKNKNASYEICQPVAWDNILLAEEIEVQAAKAGLIIFGSLASRNSTTRNTLFKLLQKTKATLLMDVNLRPPYDKNIVQELLHKANFAKLNDDELHEIVSWNNFNGTEKEQIAHVAGFYACSTICVTRGARGAILFIDNNFYEHPGFKVIAEDTVGAGDAFLAALVARLSKHSTPEKALEYACATGSFVASQKGAVPDYSEKDILELINSGRN